MPVDLFSEYYRWTVTAGGTSAPTSGASETLTVASSTGAPPASNGASPTTQFRIVDAADTNAPPEIMVVTNVSGTSWIVTRGGEGAAPWAHAGGWTALPVLTAQALQSLSTVAKFAGALNGSASPETITHNLNTRDIIVAVYNGASPYGAVSVDWAPTTVNTVTITYSPALGSGYRCVVVG